MRNACGRLPLRAVVAPEQPTIGGLAERRLHGGFSRGRERKDSSMSRRTARVVVVCLSLIPFAIATEAAGRGNASPDRDRPTPLCEMLSLRELVQDWILRRIAPPPGSREENVQLKCSMGIDPDGKPCAVLGDCSAGIDPNGEPCALPTGG